MQIQEQLRGTGVALVTPFTSNADIDFESLGKLIDYTISNGVEYLVTLGTTGESPVLDKEEKKDVINFTYEKVNGRVPVVVGIGGNDTRSLLKDLQSFPLEKATAILSASPYYNKPSQEGIFKHYQALAEAAPKPIILYNVPGRTGRNMLASTTLRLAHEVPNIAGIKEASGDLTQCMEILKKKPASFMVLSGDDNLLLPQIASGMTGVISVAANAFPRAFSDMVRACMNSDFKKAKEINDQLIPAYDLMFAENNPAGIKAFLKELNILQNHLRLPLVPLSKNLHADVSEFMKTWGV